MWGQSRAVGKLGSEAPLQTLLNQGEMCRWHRLSARLPEEEVTFSVLVSLLFLDQLGLLLLQSGKNNAYVPMSQSILNMILKMYFPEFLLLFPECCRGKYFMVYTWML